jgi:transketolase
MNQHDVDAIALTIRSLSMDAVETASSGHPGLPMGLAELGAVLWGQIMSYNPDDPAWENRDRFVLSAGHGSMFLYSLLYLSGFEVTMEDLKKFRQVGSRTAGHPEYGHLPGVETTTGPLGQGLSNAVGMAIAAEMKAATFNTAEHKIVDNNIYVIASDGDMMEGVASEASSLAGHLGLGKLIVFYDANDISIEGPTQLAFTEDVLKRYEGYDWQVLDGDAYDTENIAMLVEEAKRDTSRPSVIRLRSIIGKGAPTKAGTASVHGAALGEEELAATKKELGLPQDQEFYIHPDAPKFFERRKEELKQEYREWQERFQAWAQANPELKKKWDRFHAKESEGIAELKMPSFEKGEKVATRKASGKIIQELSKMVPNLVGGSADLAPSNNTAMPDYGDFSKEDREGRTLHFGVREHGMGAVCNGIYLYGGYRPFGATFLVFTDYMRASMRLASLMGLPIIYVMTHDSIYLGEDGPTHQPIEHVSALRAIPNMEVLRPGDAEETAEAWRMALMRTDGPTVIALTRQGLPVYEKSDAQWQKSITRGAYIVQDTQETPDVVVVATGSEVTLALDAAQQSSKNVRVVSMISQERFKALSKKEREQLIPRDVRTVVAEAGVSHGWEQFVDESEDLFTINRFGASGKGNEVATYLGFTAENLAKVIDAR